MTRCSAPRGSRSALTEAAGIARESCEVHFSHDEGAAAPVSGSTRLADHTTLRVGGEARRFVVATTDDELVATVTDCDERGEPVLVLGGGSNLLVADDGFDGTVVRVATRGINAAVSD